MVKILSTFGQQEALREVIAENGETLLALLQRERIPLQAPCGGKGVCKRCRITVSHKGARDVRLACSTCAQENMLIEVPSEVPLRIHNEGISDLLQHYLSDHPRKLCQFGRSRGVLGVAADIGTTTVAVRLYDLCTGALKGSVSTLNPQLLYGADVLSRIDAAEQDLATMSALIREEIIQCMQILLSDFGSATLRDITRIAVTGNTVMEHLFAGLSPESIGESPFTPQSLFGEAVSLDDFAAPVWLAPALSGFVGGDIMCGLLELQEVKYQRPLLFIDLGTNGELALISDERILCSATAAGPVFEGGSVHFGMPALPGAIEEVSLSAQGLLNYRTIGHQAPRGLCGTGLISAVATLLEAGIINSSGLLLDASELEAPYARFLGSELIGSNRQTVFYLTEDKSIYLTQGDIRNLQLAKAAIAAGIKTLLEESRVSLDTLAHLIIAGGFGSALAVEGAVRIGLIPPTLKTKTKVLGNAALEGIAAALLSKTARNDLLALATQSNSFELATAASFNKHYMESLAF